MVKTTEEKLLFMVSYLPDGKPMIMIGIPAAGWERMKGGKSQNFDLSSVGLPICFALFGGETNASIMKEFEAGAASAGIAILDKRRTDFKIPGSEEPTNG